MKVKIIKLSVSISQTFVRDLGPNDVHDPAVMTL